MVSTHVPLQILAKEGEEYIFLSQWDAGEEDEEFRQCTEWITRTVNTYHRETGGTGDIIICNEASELFVRAMP